ncbi:MAG TPA: PDZ domain-containing protein [Vicinamibacterales bacterium]|nr:PDZ domain-containing protein [Vicinamibacterales bacterium]
MSFPEAQHHRMQVEVTFADVPQGTLEVMMSRTSPGRYAIHEFARNVYDVQIDDGTGAPLMVERPNPSQWNVPAHRGTVRVRYKVFGDALNGTHLAIDTTHAHLNIPPSLMWARGLEGRAVRVTFDAPAQWRAATQLHPTTDPRTFTAANLHYLVDSPIELSAFTLRSFTADREFRVALHHDGSDADADRFTASLQRIVREERAVFGELPPFEAPYTFISDFLPWAGSDGMEHRNSTILTDAVRLRIPDEHLGALSTAAHEFFHSWNVERIRPRSLEPFRLDAPNPSGELWFAEGFTSYYGPLVLQRTGLYVIDEYASRLGHVLDLVTRSPARKYRSAEDVSLLAQFVDAAVWTDPTNLDNNFLSYYDWGAAIGLGLDLSLRTRTDHKVTLDDYMRRMWQEFGRPEPAAEGTVARPYTTQDLRRVLADVSGDRAFADDFFDRFVHGRELVDYTPLLSRAGLVLRKRNPGRPWVGDLSLDFSDGTPRVAAPTTEDTPLYAAGLDREDELLTFDGVTITGPSRLDEAIQRRRPGDTVRVSIRRRGVAQELTLTVADDPRLQLVPVERTGRQLTAAERAFRSSWLASKQ